MSSGFVNPHRARAAPARPHSSVVQAVGTAVDGARGASPAQPVMSEVSATAEIRTRGKGNRCVAVAMKELLSVSFPRHYVKPFAVGPVANNMIIGNVITGNGAGLTAGGYGRDRPHDAHGTLQSQSNIVASNYLADNGSPVNPRHGAVSGDFWTSNVFAGSDFPYRLPLPTDYAGVTIFDP